jgi:hypothetical protein
MEAGTLPGPHVGCVGLRSQAAPVADAGDWQQKIASAAARCGGDDGLETIMLRTQRTGRGRRL